MSEVTSLQGHIIQQRKEFDGQKAVIEEKKQQIKAIHIEIAKCKERYQIRRKHDLQEQIEHLEKEIEQLQSGKTVEDFEEKVKPFLQEQERCKDVFRMEDRLGKKVDTLASNRGGKRKLEPPPETAGRGGLMTFMRKKARTDQLLTSDETGPGTKTRVVDDFLMIVQDKAAPVHTNSEDLCEKCKEPLSLDSEQSILVCVKCGASKRYMDATSNAMAYGEEVEFCAYSYQRTNYFNEYLTMFQAKESNQVSQKDIETVMQALWEERFYDPTQITLEKIREIVRKKRMRHVYKQITQIWCRITGNAPPRLTAKQEEKCRAMFRAIQEPFEKHCPPERKNFFSYSYCLFKFMQLLGFPHFLKHFTLLKDRPKLVFMDGIWKRLAADLDWQYIESPKE